MSPAHKRPAVHVVAAAIIDAAGRVLIAQRPPGKHLAGGWEFPGGKLEPREERLAGLARELREELGIAIATPRPLIRVRHAYSSREVLLDVWIVKHYCGEPQGLDGQKLRWCSQEELAMTDLLPADKPIVAALRLPERLTQISTSYYYVAGIDSCGEPIRGKEAASPNRLVGLSCAGVVEAAAAGGADFLVMRAAVANDELAAVCDLVPVPIFARGIELEEAWMLGASGLNEIRPDLDADCARSDDVGVQELSTRR